MSSKEQNVKYQNLKEMIQKSGELYGKRPAYMFRTEQKGVYKTISHEEFRKDVDSLGTALIQMGLKGKRIALIGENRYEWGVSYLSVVNGTGIIVPLDKALPENELESLMIRSEAEAIFYSKSYDDAIKRIREAGKTNIKYFISMDLEEETDGVYSQKQLIQKGKKAIQEGDKSFIEAEIDPEKMAIMLFTSGTTSVSKAVMLSQKNIIININDISWAFDVNETDRVLSFLPLHHVFECTVGFLYIISTGACIVFCDGIRHIGDNIAEYKITVMVSVPILFEAMYKKVIKGIEKKGKLDTVKKGVKISNILLKLGIDVRKKLFKEIHETLGGKVRLLVAGGAALDPEAEKGFNELGFCLYQGYGLTETSPVVAAECPKAHRLGSIGKAFPSVQVKIDNPDQDGIGELLVKGPTVMLGYYNNEEANKKAIEPDGWFHTGDLARIDKDGYIYIVGREKSVIVLKNGKNIFPEELEILINKIEGVKESIVFGKPDDRGTRDGDLRICAKIVYDKEIMEEKYNAKTEEEIKELLWKKIKEINKEMPAYKYIRDIIVTEKELIKTTTAKVKRHEEIKSILGAEA